MAKEYQRGQRVADVVQRELAMILQRELREPQLGMITISEVKISKDLKIATIFVSSLNEQITRKEVIAYLNKSSGFYRSLLAKKVMLRRVPELHFRYDELIEQGNRLSQLISKSLKNDKDNDET